MPQGDAFDPLAAYTPRIAAMPETAPAYDQLRRPVDFPRPQCLLHAKTNACACYTQQATLMRDYPQELCLSYVQEGYFDPTRPRADPQQREGQPPHAPASSPAPFPI